MMRPIVCVLGVLATSCGGTTDPPEPACGIMQDLFVRNGLSSRPCDYPDTHSYDPGGVWEYGNCRYVDASPNFSSQLDLTCSGRLSLCGEPASGSVSWTDIGPNGEGLSSTDVTIRSYTHADGGVSFEAYGTVRVSAPDGSCAGPVDVMLYCWRAGNDPGLAANQLLCTKISYKGEPSCGTEAGWVISGFFLERLGSC